MQFKIPQDVQRPDKIVGPLTLRQLIIVGIGAGIAYSLYLVLSKQYVVQIWLIPVIFILLITAAFAFYRFHNIPFEKLILLFIEYKFRPRQRYFQKMQGDVFISVLQPPRKTVKGGLPNVKKEMLTEERLQRIAELTKRADVKKKATPAH